MHNNSEPADNQKIRDKSIASLDATQLYLSKIGYSPLLTAEEEVKFSKMATTPLSFYFLFQF